MNEEDKLPTSHAQPNDEIKEFHCSGCKTPISKYDEKCPNCERTNANYIYR